MSTRRTGGVKGEFSFHYQSKDVGKEERRRMTATIPSLGPKGLGHKRSSGDLLSLTKSYAISRPFTDAERVSLQVLRQITVLFYFLSSREKRPRRHGDAAVGAKKI